MKRYLVIGEIVSLILLVIISLSFVSAQYYGYSQYRDNAFTQYNQPTFQQFYSSQGIDYRQFWPVLDGSCDVRGDFIVNVRPGGCQPAVVRSDLLEEQNVPVFCKLDAVKLNPIIDVASLKSVGFKILGADKYIAGISYHPSQVALRIYQPVLNNPLMNDIGYAVVVLKRQINESSMPDFVEANLTAVLSYDMKNIFGAGQTSFFLPVINEQEWRGEYNKYVFWKGRGFLRADWIDRDRTEIAVYTDAENVIRKIVLTKGQTSDRIDMPGFYCRAGVRVQLKDLSAGKARARLQVDDNEFWMVENEKFLDNCYLKSIKKIGSGGQVAVRCQGKDYVLRIGISNKVKFENGKEAELGMAFENEVYLAYIGKEKQDLSNQEKSEELFVVLVKNPGKTEEFEAVKRIKQDALTYITENFNSWVIEANNNKKKDESWFANEKILNNLASALGVKKEEVEIIFQGNAGSRAKVKDVLIFKDYKFIESVGVKDKNYRQETLGADSKIYPELEDYFAETSKRAYDIVKFYGSEKDSFGEYYGARVLAELADLAGQIKKQASQMAILRNLTDKYPSSPLAKNALFKLDEISYFNYENADSTIYFGSEGHYIKLLQVIEPGIDEASAIFSVKDKDGKTQELSTTLGLNQKWFVDDSKDTSNNEYIEIKNIEEDRILIDYQHYRVEDKDKKEAKPVKETIYLKKGEALKLKGKQDKKELELTYTLTSINFKRLAEVQLISEMPDGVSEANFSVRVGIEKRAIKLNPDKTKDRIENLNESIDKFSKIVENLGKVVKTWKGACFATTGILIVKNLFSNMGGKALARQEVMKNYWKTYCAEQKSKGNYESVEACYAAKNSEIEKSVSDYAGKIKEMNSLASTLEGANAEETRNNYVKEFKSFVERSQGKKVMINRNLVDLESVFGNNPEERSNRIDVLVKNGELSVSEMRDIMMAGKLSSSQPDISKILLERDMARVYEFSQRRQLEASANFKDFGELQTVGRENVIGKKEIVKVHQLSEDGKNKIVFGTSQGVAAEVGDNYITIPTFSSFIITKADKAKTQVDYSNKLLYVPLEKRGANYGLAKKEGYILDKEGNVIDSVSSEDMNLIIGKLGVGEFIPLNKELCNNKYLNAKVKFYETEPYKGMPAVVPVDTEKGWYAATKQILPGFGMTPYKASGAVSSLWLCNVGKNGREEFDVLGDDLCIQVNYDTGQPFGQLMCLSEGEARKLASLAKSVVEEAASKYKQIAPGVRRITIRGKNYVVEKAVSSVGTECTDFMSASDCNILFNVCDPVLCPSSRCNLGGSFYVDDVVQSGIIGSIALCLPNFGSPSQGGVIVPVCLTGIYAGLDAYVSVLKAHKQCLEENLKTGAFIGICDEIYSIYLCEFFWRQGAPLLDIALPKLVEMLYTGGRTRGGGEYMTVSSAWDNAQNSLRYFTEYYAVNAMKAFRARSTGEIGTEICKAFISSNYPDNKKMLDKLLEPENPVQFYAKFDEIAYSDATLPSTSQYKVYYHIFAGRDQGHYYQVYLRNPPETSYYAAQPYLYVDSGYIGIGQYATQTKDFTAPAGYKELCVRIDMKEECGFKQVTTEFALDYLKDLYMNEQATQEVTSEKECVSGSPSLYSLVNPNIQEAGQEMLQPAIYKRGLIRVCSTMNPGNATSPGRWKDVGYCSDKRIRCWLDSESVKNVIQDKNLEKETLKKAEEIMSKEDIAKGELWLEDKTNSELKKARDKFNEIKFESIVDKDLINFIKGELKDSTYTYTNNMREVIILLDSLKNITTKGFFNNQKVEAMFLEFEVYLKLAQQYAKIVGVVRDLGVGGGVGQIQTPVEEEEERTPTENYFELSNNKIYYDGKYIKLFIKEAGNGNYKIYYDGVLFFNNWVGSVIRGEINFNQIEEAQRDWYMKELEANWEMKVGKFVLKTGASNQEVTESIEFYVNGEKRTDGTIYNAWTTQSIEARYTCKNKKGSYSITPDSTEIGRGVLTFSGYEGRLDLASILERLLVSDNTLDRIYQVEIKCENGISVSREIEAKNVAVAS